MRFRDVDQSSDASGSHQTAFMDNSIPVGCRSHEMEETKHNNLSCRYKEH